MGSTNLPYWKHLAPGDLRRRIEVGRSVGTVGGDRRSDVFVAYASPDRDRARVLYRELTAGVLSVCLDEAVLRPGDNWHRELPPGTYGPRRWWWCWCRRTP